MLGVLEDVEWGVSDGTRNRMKIVPYESFGVQTYWTTDQLLDRLARDVNTAGKRRQLKEHLVFYGRIDSSGFRIKRRVNIRNSMLPVVKGKFAQIGDHTRIEIRMYPEISVAFLILFMDAFMAFLLVGMIHTSVVDPEFPDWLAILPLFFILFTHVFMQLLFLIEVEKQKPMLTELFGKTVDTDDART